jgi:hypothetical protein
VLPRAGTHSAALWIPLFCPNFRTIRTFTKASLFSEGRKMPHKCGYCCHWQTSSTRMPGSVIPPPLVRGGQQVSSKLGPQTSSQVVMPPLVRGAQVSRAPHVPGVRVGMDVRPSPSSPSLPGAPLWWAQLCFLSLPSKSTASGSIPQLGHHPSSWPPGPLCPACKFRDRESSSRDSFVWPTFPTPVCSSTSRR